jgi:hypothetical protein
MEDIEIFEMLADAPFLSRYELPTDAELDAFFLPIGDDEPKRVDDIMEELANGSLVDEKSGETNLMAVINRRREQR